MESDDHACKHEQCEAFLFTSSHKNQKIFGNSNGVYNKQSPEKLYGLRSNKLIIGIWVKQCAMFIRMKKRTNIFSYCIK